MTSLQRTSTSAALLTLILLASSDYHHLTAEAYNILMIPIPGRSHLFSLATVAESLVRRGHRVSLLVAEHFRADLPELEANSSAITLVRYSDSHDEDFNTDYDAMFDNMTSFAITHRVHLRDLVPIIRHSRDHICQNLISYNDELLTSLSQQNFDLAVVDGVFIMKCIYLVPHRLGIPWITYSDVADPLVMRAPWLPSFVPHSAVSLTDRMSFTERLQNTLLSMAFHLYSPFPDPPAHVLNKYRRYGPFRDLDELMSRSLLWLLTKDVVLDYSRPMMFNMVNIGGLTVRRSSGTLPGDVRRFINGAERGVVLVTFGSTTSSLPAHVITELAAAFRRLPGYHVLWRLNNKDAVELPENVMISSWLPQNDILAHPAVKLFITHCGNNGQFEAVYHGVPMVGFPISSFPDQVQNARRLEHKGYGLAMDLYDFTADQLLDNIHKVLADASYKDRVQKASKIFRSQAQSPVERATFWIEHVCRFGGDHLRSAGSELSLYQYLVLDVLAIILLTCAAVVFLVVKCVTLILAECRARLCCSGAKHKMD